MRVYESLVVLCFCAFLWLVIAQHRRRECTVIQMTKYTDVWETKEFIDAATAVRLKDYSEAFLKVKVADAQDKVKEAFATLTAEEVNSKGSAYEKVIGELAAQGIYVSTVGTSNAQESK